MEEAFGEADGQNSWSFLTSSDALAKSAEYRNLGT